MFLFFIFLVNTFCTFFKDKEYGIWYCNGDISQVIICLASHLAINISIDIAIFRITCKMSKYGFVEKHYNSAFPESAVFTIQTNLAWSETLDWSRKTMCRKRKQTKKPFPSLCTSLWTSFRREVDVTWRAHFLSVQCAEEQSGRAAIPHDH